MKYGNTLFTSNAIGSGGVWLFMSALSIEAYIQSVQHLIDKTGNNQLTLLPGHTGENRSPETKEYIWLMLMCAKALVDGSITSVPFCRTIGGMATLGNVATVGQASIIYNLNKLHQIKGALRSLNISSGNLTPRFAPYTTYYSASVSADIKTFAITQTELATPFQSLTINGHQVENGSAYEATLTNSDNQFSIVITTKDKTTKTYTLTITKAKL